MRSLPNRLLLIFVLLFTTVLVADAQNVPMIHYGIEDGLPSNKIYDIYRDSKGFLWFGTDKGVAKYNGVKFEKYTSFNGLADNEVFFFQEDAYGRLWLATYNGELCYYKDGLFHTAANTPFLKLPFKTYFISSINLEKDSSVTISFGEQSFFVNINGNKCKTYDIGIKANHNYFAHLAEYKPRPSVDKYFYSDVMAVRKYDKGGYVMLCRRKNVYLDEQGLVKRAEIFDDSKLQFYHFGQNQQFITDGDNIYSPKGDTLRKFPKDFYSRLILNPRVRRFYFSGSNFFVASDTGLYVNDNTLLLAGGSLTSITQDVNGNYWLGSLSHGIQFIDKSLFSATIADSLYKGVIRYSTLKNGSLFYVNSSNNLYTFSGDKASCLFSYEKQFPERKSNYPTQPGYFLDDQMKYYFFDYLNNCVVENVFAAKLKIKQYKTFFLRDNIKSIYKNNEALYLQNRAEIIKINYADKKEGEQIDAEYNDINKAKQNSRIFAVSQAANEQLWYATRDSMYKIVNDSSYVQQQFGNITFKTFLFIGKYIVGYSLSNTMYICSNYDGKVIADSITEQNCIWDRLYKIDVNHVLVSTNNYYRIITLDVANGAHKHKVTVVESPIAPLLAESISADSNNIYFFKNGSITTIATRTLLRQTDAPILFFTTLKIGDTTIAVKNEYEVPYVESGRISLSFDVISFDGKEPSFQYSIAKDNDGEWTDISGQDINLANPGYGTYTVKVRAKTISSTYSGPVTFVLYIKRPYWATWWFAAIGLLVITGLVVVIVRQRISAVVKRKARQHDSEVKFMRSEYKALNALMNPHFIFNTLNNVQSLFNGNNKLAANKYLRIFADLIRQNMHNVSKELITLQKEMDLVKNYLLLEELRFEDKLRYNISIDPKLELYEIMVPPLLIQPLVENSIKHGILPMATDDGFIQLVLSETDGVLKIVVKDNGAGMNNAKASAGSLHESFGLDNIRKRIEQLSMIQGKEMSFEMKEEVDALQVRWTVVVISMPL